MADKHKTPISPDEAHAAPMSMRAALPDALALLARIGWDRAPKVLRAALAAIPPRDRRAP